MRIFLLSISLAAAALMAQSVEPARLPVPLPAPVQDKNFYVLSLLEEKGLARDAIKADATLAALAAAKRDALTSAAKACAFETACYVSALKFNDADTESVSGALRALAEKNPAVKQLASGPLRRSGMYVRYHDKPAPDLLAAAWMDAAKGINNAIEVYAQGRAPRYPAIDSVAYDVKAASFTRLVKSIVSVEAEFAPSFDLFFHAPLRFAFMLMNASRRDEAGRLEPLESGENKLAVQRIRTTTWSKYPYSVIVVPGSGTSDVHINLSAASKLRVILAAKRYKEGKAPFILVSGGYVHPNQTPHSEAVEMKKALMAEFGIPASAILIDPHARHTTTNMRNAARQMYRYGMPFDKKALVTTDEDQSAGIESPAFARRCMRELGYVPHEIIGRVSLHDLEFLPKIESLHSDALDPLDP